MVPSKAKIFLAAFSSQGIPDLELMRLESGTESDEAVIAFLEERQVISLPSEILSLDLMKVETQFDRFKGSFEVSINQEATLGGMVGWFDVEMGPENWFSTSPYQAKTHWEHTLFPFECERLMNKGDVLKGTVECSPLDSDHRALTIRIEVKAFNEGQDFIKTFIIQ